MPTREQPIPCAWFSRHLLREILPTWLRLSVRDNGFLMPSFDRAWQPTKHAVTTLVTQSRLIYNFSQGYRLTGEKAYGRAVECGARFLIGRFADKAYGGWVWSCDSEGTVLDFRKDAYGHAFAILGLAHAYQTTGCEEFRRAALATWGVLDRKFRDREGGFAWKMTRDFSDCDAVREQGPVMHLFEALLALAECVGPSALSNAEQLAAFVFSRLFRDDGSLPEAWSLNWEIPAAGTPVYIGHAFEWAYLLSRAVEMGLPENYLGPASGLLDYGVRVGLDRGDGGFYTAASLDGQLTSRQKVGWTECEAIRALLHFAAVRDRGDLWELLANTVDYVRRDFVDAECGGWFEYRDAGCDPPEQDKGHMGVSDHPVAGLCKVDYHVVGMCVEAIRLEKLRGEM